MSKQLLPSYCFFNNYSQLINKCIGFFFSLKERLQLAAMLFSLHSEINILHSKLLYCTEQHFELKCANIKITFYSYIDPFVQIHPKMHKGKEI